jgi:hypothetical protein
VCLARDPGRKAGLPLVPAGVDFGTKILPGGRLLEASGPVFGVLPGGVGLINSRISEPLYRGLAVSPEVELGEWPTEEEVEPAAGCWLSASPWPKEQI